MLVLQVLFVIGLAKLLWKVCQFLYSKLYERIDLERYRYGSVCVTGATSGTGKALAKEFLRRGFRVVLVSRSLEKLVETKKELVTETGQSTVDFVQADFAKVHDEREFYEDLYQKLVPFNVSVLVNNAGLAECRFLHEMSLQSIEDILRVNVDGYTLLLKKFIGEFERRFLCEGRRSLYLRVGSQVTSLYLPRFTLYSATKIYNDVLAQAVQLENYAGLDTAIVRPSQVSTNLLSDQHLPITFVSIEPDTFAQALLSSLKLGVNTGHWKHAVLHECSALLPYGLQRYVTLLLGRLMTYFGIA